ncbi:MAG: mechanosensitive ion channel family protein [Anderseniella sp.]
MEIDTSNWPNLFRQTGDRLNNWLASINHDTLALSVIIVALTFFFRKLLARWIVGALQSLLKQFSVSVSDEVVSQLQKATEILAVTLSVYLALEVFNPPEMAGGFLRRVLMSIGIVAVFGTWYQLSGSFVSLLRDGKYNPVNVETDWAQRIAQFAIILFGIASLLKVWQVDITGALTGVGVLGAGLAIAAQDLIRNLIAGMTNMSEKRFKTGDIIQVEGQFVGTVKKIDLRSTLIEGFDQIPRYVPNSDLSNAVVQNYSTRKRRRVMLKIPLLLSSTPEQIEAIRDSLKDYHQTCGDFDLSTDAAKYIYVSDLAPSSVDILLWAWTKGPDYDEFIQITERLTLAILRIVRDAGTDLAYPTQTVKLDTSSSKPLVEPGQSPV